MTQTAQRDSPLLTLPVLTRRTRPWKQWTGNIFATDRSQYRSRLRRTPRENGMARRRNVSWPLRIHCHRPSGRISCLQTRHQRIRRVWQPWTRSPCSRKWWAKRRWCRCRWCLVRRRAPCFPARRCHRICLDKCRSVCRRRQAWDFPRWDSRRWGRRLAWWARPCRFPIWIRRWWGRNRHRRRLLPHRRQSRIIIPTMPMVCHSLHRRRHQFRHRHHRQSTKDIQQSLVHNIWTQLDFWII